MKLSNKEIWAFRFCFTLLVGLIIIYGIHLVSSLDISCYQESVNISNQLGTDGNCGLNYTGNWYSDVVSLPPTLPDPLDSFDGNYSSPQPHYAANKFFSINYTKPNGFNASIVKWKIGWINDTTANYQNLSLNITSNCIKQNKLMLYYDINNWIPGVTAHDTFYCYNGTDYQILLDSTKNYWGYFYDEGITWKIPFYENNQSFNQTLFSSSNQNFNINFSIDSDFTLNSINFIYNGTYYNASSIISYGSGNYVANKQLIVPLVTGNYTFYWQINSSDGNSYNSTINSQVINNLNISTDCSLGFNVINISNLDEENFSSVSGTVEYVLNLLSNNNQITSTNGTATGYNFSLCSNSNLSNSYLNYNLQLRYYDLAGNYLYKTYNIQNSQISNLPIIINLYYLTKSIGTQFKINYVDFNYLTYPGAVIQIQRQYLATNTYNTVEIPSIDNNGQVIGSFNANNIRYKLIVINNGVILDTFNDIFPSCQNIVLGQCELSLRGSQTATPNSNGDFTYTLNKTSNSLILTYIIPSGTPRTITFSTNQNSRFLSGISICNTTLFASGGTITCGYNSTVGDSIIDTTITNSDGTSLYGSVMIAEDLSSFFMLNNFVIAFVLLLSLSLMFISSAVMLVIGAGVGIIFLGLIFLLRGADLVTISSSLGWLIVAIVIIIYYISKKEERT